jgi:hypothetical protein
MGDGLRWIGGRWIEVRDAVDWAVASRGGGVGHRTEESGGKEHWREGRSVGGKCWREGVGVGGSGGGRGGVGHRTEESAAGGEE